MRLDPNRKLKSWQRERTGRALQLSNEFILELLRLCGSYRLRTVQDTVWLLFAEFTGMTQQKPQVRDFNVHVHALAVQTVIRHLVSIKEQHRREALRPPRLFPDGGCSFEHPRRRRSGLLNLRCFTPPAAASVTVEGGLRGGATGILQPVRKTLRLCALAQPPPLCSACLATLDEHGSSAAAGAHPRRERLQLQLMAPAGIPPRLWIATESDGPACGGRCGGW